MFVIDLIFFFFKQKTAYELRISDWSSDVCSSDLRRLKPLRISSFSQFGLGCIGNSVEQGVDCREAAGWRGLAAGWTGGAGVGALALSATGGGDGPGEGLGLAGVDGLPGGVAEGLGGHALDRKRVV